MTKPFKPMLAAPMDPALLRFPCLASPKLDGVRCMAMLGLPMSRSMKVLPNRFIQDWFATNQDVLQGMDGELIIGSPTAEDCYRKTVSAVMSEDGEPDFTYYVFDYWDLPYNPYAHRSAQLDTGGLGRISLLFSERLDTVEELDAYEARCLEEGYEGVILRCPNSPYKQGRSTAREGYLLKVKRYEDAEATITGWQEEMHNGNEAFTSEIGSTKRSTHQENKTGKGTLGAWVVKGLTAFEGIEFRIGTGMDAAYRASAWLNRESMLGQIVKFKHFAIGGKDAPRHPVYLGLRGGVDL